MSDLDAIILERGKVYGPPRENHEGIAQMWAPMLRPWAAAIQRGEPLPPHVVALLMALLKIDRMRLVYHPDNYPDAANYLRFAEEWQKDGPEPPCPIAPSPTRPLIFLDMDGVCCDFHTAALALHRRPGLIVTDWDIPALLGISTEAFWKPIEKKGSSFWRGLHETPWFLNHLYPALIVQGRVLFCSSPSYCSGSVKGKLLWLQDRLGRDFRDYVFTPRKELLAQPGAVLIDDNEVTCEAWRKYGGKAIVFPRPWNEGGGWPSTNKGPWDIGAAT